MKKHSIILSVLIALAIFNVTAQADENFDRVRYGVEKVDGIDIFYREAGDPSKTPVVLLHGFPSSSHQYRELLAALGDEFYLFAPDYPGYGDSSVPSVDDYAYTFDNLAITMEKLLDQRGLNGYVLVIHDFGAPVGFRIATKNPKKVAGFVVMNGNAYEEGLSELVLADLATKRTPESEEQKKQMMFGLEGLKWQYTHGARNPSGINPDNWNLDYMKMSQPGAQELNLNLMFDYKNNLPLYPVWQKYLRDNQPPMLITWGKNDAIFTESGAAAYKKDVKNIDYHILDAGHFVLEENAPFVIDKMRQFLRGL